MEVKMPIIVRRNGDQQALVRYYRPWGLLDEMDTFAREMRERSFTLDDSLLPYADLYEENGQLIMKTELPGIDQKDLDITIEGDRLTIKAEKKEEVKEDVTHHTRERYYGQYFRSVMLPYPVKENKISATFDKGVLELRLPKVEEVKAKKIQIKAQLSEGKQEKPKRVRKQKVS
jgi:HSP20 family protein